MIGQEDRILARLDGDALTELADYFESLARVFRAQSQYRLAQAACQRRIAAELDHDSDSGRVAADLVAAGADPDQVVDQLAQMHQVPRETITHYLKRAQADRAKAAKMERDRRIMKRAGRGWSNKQIADSEGLHPNTVSRIITKTMRSSG